MNRSMKLASHLAVVLSVAALVTTSAFAGNRHSGKAYGRDSGRNSSQSGVHRDQHGTNDFSRRFAGRQQNNRQQLDQRPSRSWDRGRTNERGFDRGNSRSFDRGRTNERSFDLGRTNERTYDRGNDRSFDRGRINERGFDRGRSNETFRNDFRGSYGSHVSYDRGRQPYFASGQVSRYERCHGGYHVWLGGVAYPFFIPEARFLLFPHFHIGLSIRLGGYYNPLGYYDYYDGAYGSNPVYTSGALRGVVESVDYRRGTFVVHDDLSGSFVTAAMRGYDSQLSYLRPGDYIEVSGDWTGTGLFEAYSVASLNARVDGYGS